MNIQDKKIIVIGLGLTGLSCLRWLIHAGAKVVMADSRHHPPGLAAFRKAYPHISLHLGPLQTSVLQKHEVIVRSPGISQYEPALLAAAKAGIPIIGDIELFAQQIKNWPSKVLATTGSNGKSTVTTMVGDMARAAGLKVIVAGNIGVPILDALLALESSQAARPDVFVLELPSFQLETTWSLNATAATVLNISEDHLDRYKDMADYANTKARIFQGTGRMVINYDDLACKAMDRPDRKITWFGQDLVEEDAYSIRQVVGEYVLQHGKTTLLPVTQLPVAGLHNALNALAAIALCEAAGIACAPLLQGLQKFTGLAHRMQYVVALREVTYYNDSKGTNVGATEAALKGMSQPVILIAGGQGKGQDFSPLKLACGAHCRMVILMGEDAELIEAALEDIVPVVKVNNIEAAVTLAADKAQPHDIVLLSPACASLDMFADYKQRGEAFIFAVQKLRERG